MNTHKLENRIKELELELSNLKSEIIAGKQLENKLRQSESILLESQKIANMGSFIHNLNDQTALWTENCFVLYGYKPFEFEPTLEHFKNRVHPDDWHIVEEGFDFVFKNKMSTKAEMRIILPDGTVRWFQNNIVPIFQDDKIVKINGINIDITERKISDIALKESVEKSRSIMENSADAIFIANRQGKYIYTNKEVSSMLGYTSEEMKNKTIADITNPNKHEEIFRTFSKVLSEGKCYTEIELLKKDGSFIVTDLNTVLLPDGTVYGSCRDITERKHAEAVLSKSERRTRALLDANPDMIFRMNREGTYLDYKADTTDLYVQAEASIIGKKNRDIMPPEFADLVDRYIKQTLDSGELQEFEYQMITPKRGLRNYEARMVASGIDEVITLVRDITERKQAEEEIKLKNALLVKLNTDKDRFISILSHDLRSPFNNLLGLSEILTEDFSKLNIDEIKSLGNQIYTTARNTYNLLEDILKWVGAQQGKIPFNPQILNFRDICIDVFEILSPNANTKNITINYSASDEINIFADIDMLKTIIRNLVSNAIKFTSNGGTIIINTEENSGNVTISVSDNGIGIIPDDLKKLFDISEVLTTKGTAGETGTGLGLLLCKEFVEKHRVKFGLKVKPGKEVILNLLCQSLLNVQML